MLSLPLSCFSRSLLSPRSLSPLVASKNAIPRRAFHPVRWSTPKVALVCPLLLPPPSSKSNSSPSLPCSSPLSASVFFRLPITAPTLSDVIDQKVSVLVDPIRMIFDNSTDFGLPLLQNWSSANKILSSQNTSLCALTLHRSANCEGHQIKPSERIGWDTRICFRWTCDGIGTVMAMRVENCWTGSERNPIELIDHRGCSREEAMISSPTHRHVQRKAHSLGWLTVRLFNTNKIRLSCAIRICHACEKECRKKIMPNCTLNGEEKRRREAAKELEEMCWEERRKGQLMAQRSAERTARTRIGLTMLAITWTLLNKPTRHW